MPLCNSYNKMFVLWLIVHTLWNQLLLELSLDLFNTCRYVTDILKMCIKKFDAEKVFFDKLTVLHIEVRSPVLLCAVKTVEGDFRFCWTITPNVGQTHKENPNLVRILYMVCTLNDIYKQYNKLHEHWYTKISSLRCVADRNPPQNASDLYTKYWSDAEHCRSCTRLSGVNWWKQKNK